METYKNLKKGTKIGLIASLVLLVGCLAVEIPALVRAIGTGNLFFGLHAGIDFLMIVLVAFYALIGYKKPHGNLLRVVFFTFGAVTVLEVALGMQAESNALLMISNICCCLTGILTVFVSGRLHKIEQNKILLAIAGLLLIGHAIVRALSIPGIQLSMLGLCVPFALLFILSFAYTARYEEHKAAGLADKADVEEK